MPETSEEEPSDRRHTEPRRVHPRVALAILETIRAQDLPAEVLDSENPSVTMPRRLGLSEVVDRQIARYRDDARRRLRVSDEELRDLIQLAIRRPDSEEIFFLVGGELVGGGGEGLRRIVPRRLGYFLARRALRRRLRNLFGRRLGGFAQGSFAFEGRALPFIRADPGGDACALVSGLAQAIVSRYVGDGALVLHVACQARGDPLCRWEATNAGSGAEGPGVGRASRGGEKDEER